MQSVVFSSASNPLRNRFGLLHTGVERHQDEEGKIQNGAHLRQQGTTRCCGNGTQHTQDDEAHTEDHQPQLAQPALVTNGLDRTTVEPGQYEQHGDCGTHCQYPGECRASDGRHGTQDGVEGCEVPDRSDVVRGLQRVGDFEVRLLQEVTAHFREEEHHGAEHEQEDHHADDILDGVVGVERDTVERDAVFIFQLLDFDAVGVVRANLVQGNDVQHNQTQQDDRHSNHVQREETVQGDAGDQVV